MEAMSSGSQKTALAKMVSDFHAAHPNITVTLQEQPDYGTLYTKITAAAAAGNPPTIAQVYEEWAAELAANQVITPLTSYASTAELNAFYPGIRKDLYLPDGKLWMWPFNKSVVIQYYNQNILASAGVSAAPKTWDEFASDAKKVSKGKVVAISIDPGNSSGPQGGTAWYEILAQSFGEPVFAKDGTPQFTSKAAVQALQYLVDLKNAHALATGTNYPGQTALGAQTGVWDISSVASYPYNLAAVGKKFTMGTADLPTGPAGPANQLAGTNIALFSAASKAQQDAAWIFLQFLTSPQEQAYWASQTGYLPLGPAALQTPTLQSYAKDHPYLDFASKDLGFATGLPPYPWITKASGDLAEGLQAALSGSKSPQDALADAQSAAMKDKQAAG
jgi:ABC-type glycerol-3-phosphate transport system substrate-binding protein